MEKFTQERTELDEFYRNITMQEAAPAMYQALKGLLEVFVGIHGYSYDGEWDKEVKAAQAALAKADGEK